MQVMLQQEPKVLVTGIQPLVLLHYITAVEQKIPILALTQVTVLQAAIIRPQAFMLVRWYRVITIMLSGMPQANLLQAVITMHLVVLRELVSAVTIIMRLVVLQDLMSAVATILP